MDERTVHALRALASRVEAGAVVPLAAAEVVSVDLRGAPSIEVHSLLRGLDSPRVEHVTTPARVRHVVGSLLHMHVRAILSDDDPDPATSTAGA